MSAKKQLTLSQALLRKKCKDRQALHKHLSAFNAGVMPQWKDLEKSFLIEFVEYLKERLAPESARTYCAVFKSILNIYKEEVHIPCDSRNYAKILSLKKVYAKHIYLTDEEIQLLIDYMPTNKSEAANKREHTVRNQFVISCLTAMRHSDTIRTDVNNIDEEGVLSFLSQKTTALSSIYSCQVVEKLLNQNMNHTYSLLTFNATIREICKNVGITQPVMVIKAGKKETGEKYKFITSHTARRSFATNIYKKTKDLLLVSKLMNHSDTKTTETYICIDISERKDVKEYLNQFKVP